MFGVHDDPIQHTYLAMQRWHMSTFISLIVNSLCNQEDKLIRVRNDIPVEGAATLMINPATALRMLEDYVPLKEGDWVVQNGANSAVGLAVIQIAKVG